MPRKSKQFHYIYKTTNLVNGKWYIGMHSTDNLEDGYIGSGKRLWLAIRKYGRENFKLQILEFFPDRSSLRAREREIVNESCLLDPLCMNISVGGEGGFLNREAAAAGARGTHKKIWNDPAYIEKIKLVSSQTCKRLHEEGKMYPPDWTGKKHREETKRVIGQRNSESQKGSRNSQFGKVWIHDLEKSVRVPREEVSSYLETGWKIGRKMNFKRM